MVADYAAYHNELNDNGLDKYQSMDSETLDNVLLTWERCDPWPTPTKLLAKQYDMKPVDLSFPGSGNKQIFNKLSDYVINNHSKIGLVVACWSSFTRIDFETRRRMIPHNDYQSIVFHSYDKQASLHLMTERIQEIWSILYDDGYIFPERDIADFYRFSYLLDNLCSSHDIECVQCASIVTWPYDNKFVAKFIGNPMMEKINHINFWGWPILYELGGKPLFDSEKMELRISKQDGHPNAAGHQFMANRLIEFIDSRGIL